MKRSYRASVLAAATLLVVGLLIAHRVSVARQSAAIGRPAPLVQVGVPVRRDIERKLLLTADVLAIQQADLMAKVAGYLETIHVDRGDRVHAGQLLAVIRQPELERQLQQAEAADAFTSVTYQRMEELFRRQLVARQDVDDARTKYEVAHRGLELQRTYLDYANIRAPFDGWVTKRYLDPGALIPQATGMTSAASTILTVMDLSQVKVLVNVPERDVTNVHVGDPITLTADAYPGRTFTGQVTKFAPALEPSTRTLEVEIDVPNADLALKPGMFARAVVVLERHADTLVVPAQALIINELGSFVDVVEEAQGDAPTVRQIAVQTGIEDGDDVEVITGLSPDARIVRAGKELVHDGSRVRVAVDDSRRTGGAN